MRVFKSVAVAVAVAAACLLAYPTQGETAPRRAAVGDRYEITLTRDSVEESSGSSGSSHDQDAVVERVVGLRADGLELEYDLPDDATREDRARTWQLPAGVFQPFNGPMRLLNAAELERRVDAWLKRARWPRTVCGDWIFTWNGLRIDCDPQSVVKALEAFDLRLPHIREGAAYQDRNARAVAPLALKNNGPGGTTFTAELQIDPEAVRRQRAETDVAVGEIMRKPVALEASLRERAKEEVSGTIAVTLETDATGNVRRSTKVVKVESKRPGKPSETHTTTEVLERRLLTPTRAHR